MSDQPQTLSIPSLLLLAALSALAVRYFFFTPTSTSTSGTPGRGNSRAANPADIEQIAQMFPQIPRRDIMWDLQRNGGSVAATTERLLGTGGLERPPPTFQPPLPPPSTPSTAHASPAQAIAENINLIKRYNLSAKLSSPSSTPGAEGAAVVQPGWSNNKSERQVLLQRRREEMVLTARRKMEERERERAGSRGGGGEL